MQAPAARILIVDDHTLVRQGFRQLFSESPGEFDVVAEAGDGATALDLIGSIAPSLAIIDLDLENSISGLDLLIELRRRGSKLAILICSMTTEPSVVANVLLQGADGYVFKSVAREETLSAVRTVLGGQKYLPMPSDVLRSASRRFEARALRAETYAKVLSTCTAKERELLGHLRRGLSSREAAILMDVSEKTVERHRANIRTKHGLTGLEFLALVLK